MNKFGFAAVAFAGLAAATVGLSAPAVAAPIADQAAEPVVSTGYSTGVDHNSWLDQIRPNVYVPSVDTSVRQSR